MTKHTGMILAMALGFGALTVQGSETKTPWEKAGVNAGVFFSRLNSHVRYGAGVGVDIDPEKLLGLNAQETVFRTDGFWRFSNNRRHRLDLSWFSYRRDSERQVLEGFVINDPDGNAIAVTSGTVVQSSLNLDIYEAAYSYSFFQDDRFDLAVRGGLYVMPIEIMIKAAGLLEGQGSMKFTAPLPVLGYRLDMALTPKWIFRTGTQLFYIQYKSFEGSLLEAQGSIEYAVYKNAALGLGFDTFNFNVSSGGSDYPGVDLEGSAGFRYTGLQLYARMAFD